MSHIVNTQWFCSVLLDWIAWKLIINLSFDCFRFILSDPEDGLYEDLSFDEFNPESLREKEELKQNKIQELIAEVNFQE